MKKRILALAMAIAMLVGVMPVSAFAEGETQATNWITEADTDWYTNDAEGATEFTIDSAAELAGLAKLVNEGNNFSGKTVKLGNNIDLAGKEWTAIGSATESSNMFLGEFDGKDYTISNLTMSGSKRGGLFISIKGTAEVHDLVIDNANVSVTFNSNYARGGALAGQIWTGGTVYEVTVKNSSVQTDGNTATTAGSHNTGSGGLSGYIFGANVHDIIISNVTLSNSVGSGSVWLGGLTGMAESNSTIKDIVIDNVTLNHVNNGNVHMGGAIGSNGNSTGIDNNVTVSNVTVNGVKITSNASGILHAGGFAGQSVCGATNCTVTGLDIDLTANDTLYYAGGLLGNAQGGTYTNCSATGDIDVNGRWDSTAAGFAGYVGAPNNMTAVNCTANVTTTALNTYLIAYVYSSDGANCVNVTTDAQGNEIWAVGPAPSGEVSRGMYSTSNNRIQGAVMNANPLKSVVLELYSGETKIATTTLTNESYFANAATELTWNFCITGTSSSWNTVWETGHPRDRFKPDKVVLYIDGVKVAENTVTLYKDNFDQIGEEAVWAELNGVNTGHVRRTYPAKKYLVRAATCTEPAEYYESCSLCDEALGATFTSGKALGHKERTYPHVDHLAQPADCENAAVYYRSCEVCKQNLTDLPTFSHGEPLGHEERTYPHVDHLMQPADCENAAVYYRSCEVCKQNLTDLPTFSHGEPLGHKERTYPHKDHLAQPADCENAAVYYRSCEVCKKNLTDLPTFSHGEPLGHDYDEGVITTPASCEGKGVKTFTCKRDASHTYTEEISATGHTWGAWITRFYATTYSHGIEVRTCAVCGAEDTRYTAKLVIDVQPNVNNPVVSLKYLNTQDHIAYIKGYEDATIRPNHTITRAEVATIFYRLLTDEARAAFETAVNGFSDVNAKDWFNVAVSTLDNAGIIQDVKGGKFRPNEPITRAELFVMAAQFVQLTGGKVPVTYIPDVADDHWAADEIKLLVFAGLLKGYEDGTIRPDNTLTRAAAITVINRMLKRAITEEALPEVMVTFKDCTVADWFYEAVQEAVNGHEYIRSTDKVEGYDYNYEIWTSLK